MRGVAGDPLVCQNQTASLVCPVTLEEQPEGTLPDIQIAQEAMRFLDGYDTSLDPFFLAVGFNKPHIPLKFPKEYMDLFPDMGLAENYTKPEGLPDIAWNPWEDLRRRDDVKALNVSFPYGPLPLDYQKEVRRAYYAATTYIDDLIGQVLETLEKRDLAKNTIIVLIGDHGWSLGEHQEWAKYSNLKVATNTPLLLRVPVLTELMDHRRMPFRHHNPFNLTTDLLHHRHCAPTEGCVMLPYQQESHQLVELVDLFPTLAQLTGLPVPGSCPSNGSAEILCTEGRSLFSLLDHHSTSEQDDPPPRWTNQSFSQYPRPSLHPKTNSDQPALRDMRYMGYSAHLDHLHYITWLPFDPSTFTSNWTMAVAHELYDLSTDPLEYHNLYNSSDIATNSRFQSILKARFSTTIVS
ncbi:IDS [Cordylochernes scorpioides]|uniref:IDS n=1 Tax=Cordylochernes scorpioides TaxID=51811 RepID=A0ABY6LPY5_9ARAC|nr:IDS [Cordylochernes scorpioides]